MIDMSITSEIGGKQRRLKTGKRGRDPRGNAFNVSVKTDLSFRGVGKEEGGAPVIGNGKWRTTFFVRKDLNCF